jgi:hypothetical protein
MCSGVENPFFGKKHKKESMEKRTLTRKIKGIKPLFTGKGCKHYNNGEKSIFCLPGSEPIGFVPGRIMKNMKGDKNASCKKSTT